MAVFGTIRVERTGNMHSRNQTTLTFTDRDTYNLALTRLLRMQPEGINVADAFWGYVLYDNADAAVEDAEFWCRTREHYGSRANEAATTPVSLSECDPT